MQQNGRSLSTVSDECILQHHILARDLTTNHFLNLYIFIVADPKQCQKQYAQKAKMSPFMVLARGFPWKVTKKDVFDFFAGVKILHGEKGVNIIKNGAMEAYVELPTKAERKKALALSNKKVDSRVVYGK